MPKSNNERHCEEERRSNPFVQQQIASLSLAMTSRELPLGIHYFFICPQKLSSLSHTDPEIASPLQVSVVLKRIYLTGTKGSGAKSLFTSSKSIPALANSISSVVMVAEPDGRTASNFPKGIQLASQLPFGLGFVKPYISNFATLVINFWANQGILHFYNAEGNVYHDFEPNHYGSMCLPLNWTGRSEEYFVHNPNVDEGGIYDGYGRKVLQFPDDGHPDMCNATLNITGDCRDEIVVWNPYEIWVYTQSDNPLNSKLYKPIRNPLYNYSNYQATVSFPGWNE